MVTSYQIFLPLIPEHFIGKDITSIKGLVAGTAFHQKIKIGTFFFFFTREWTFIIAPLLNISYEF